MDQKSYSALNVCIEFEHKIAILNLEERFDNDDGDHNNDDVVAVMTMMVMVSVHERARF